MRPGRSIVAAGRPERLISELTFSQSVLADDLDEGLITGTHRVNPMAPPPETLGLLLGGGGARGAYQAGVLRGIARRFPELTFPVLTGISAGAVNALHLAAHPRRLRRATEDLVSLWLKLTPEQVFDVQPLGLVRNIFATVLRLFAGGLHQREPTRGAVDTEPLRRFLEGLVERKPDGSFPGIDRNIARGVLRAVAISATSYTTGKSVTWAQGPGADFSQPSQRRIELTRLTVDHVMASAALPLFFPAVKVGREWFGDGGMRLTAPLSPALHLGATRILTISTRYQRTADESTVPDTIGYPPPAQVVGVLYNAIFLDLIDEDILRLRKLNRFLSALPREARNGMRIVDIFVIRPSRDLGRLAREFEPRLPWFFRYLTRGLGTRQTASPDMLSIIMFQHDYLQRLVELGEADAAAHADRLGEFLAGKPTVL